MDGRIAISELHGGNGFPLATYICYNQFNLNMNWQDIVITVASVVFVYAMVPQIIYGYAKKQGVITYQFSILNIIAMIALTINYYSLNLLFSAAVSLVLTVLWTVLLIQRIIYPS